VPREALAGSGEARREGDDVPAKAVDRLHVGRGVGLIEARELLQSLPRRVLRKEVRRDLDLKIDRVRRLTPLRHRERHAPLEPRSIVNGDPDLGRR
jgi:hypothetical protein